MLRLVAVELAAAATEAALLAVDWAAFVDASAAKLSWTAVELALLVFLHRPGQYLKLPEPLT